MRHVSAVTAAILLGSALLIGCASQPGPPSFAQVSATAANPAVRRVAEANNDFGFRLLSKLDKGPSSGNVFFSPFSASSALMMTVNGAGGNTKREMAATLGLGDEDVSRANQGYAQLLPYLRNPDKGVELSIANALWVQSQMRFDPEFQKVCVSSYGAKTTALDLRAPSGAKTINNWTSQNTHGKITEIVSPEALRSAVAVLTNAIYFHGQWTTKFDKSETKTDVFYLESGAKKPASFMSQMASFPYLENNSFQAIAMPYSTGRVSFYVLLPKKGTSIEKLAGALNDKSWDQWMPQFNSRRVYIILPRFHTDYSKSLSKPLIALGMADAFDPQRADFTPMGLGKKVSISDVLHKATLDVDEEGTTAAAATAVIMTKSAIMVPRPTIEMRVDHPFFCAIRDNTTGAILFEGVIRDPK